MGETSARSGGRRARQVATTDVTIARLDRRRRIDARASLREALGACSFSTYGPALAGPAGAVRQEIFLARFR